MGSEFKWILGSIGAVIVFGAGLLIYGIVDSQSRVAGRKVTIDAGEGAVVKIDRWECVKGQDQRGMQYEYSRINAMEPLAQLLTLAKRTLDL